MKRLLAALVLVGALASCSMSSGPNDGGALQPGQCFDPQQDHDAHLVCNTLVPTAYVTVTATPR